jgi:formylglycine-generating enzyme required for sulfatase activity
LTAASGLPDSEQCCDEPLTKEPAAGAAAADEPDSRWFHPERAGYRLPTEAEWEYASRAGMVALYGFGSDRSVMPAYANYLETSQNRTRFSGELRPNLRGLFDMHGNILEWCYDWFGPFDVSREQIDPLGMTRSSTRVLKGGSWSSAGRDCRSADRHDYAPVFRGSRVGFRIVRTPTVTASR